VAASAIANRQRPSGFGSSISLEQTRLKRPGQIRVVNAWERACVGEGEGPSRLAKRVGEGPVFQAP
jgi:hypothetical protein